MLSVKSSTHISTVLRTSPSPSIGEILKDAHTENWILVEGSKGLEIMRNSKLSSAGNVSQLNLIIPFNDATIKPYWLILGSPPGTIKLNENIDSNGHLVETSNDILSSDT